MRAEEDQQRLEEMKKLFPEKFSPEEQVFGHIHRGDRIFVGTGCGEPRYLVHALVDYAEKHPTAFFDTEIIHLWTVGEAPYTQPKFKRNFRLNSFFTGENTAAAVSQGLADYTPIFLSRVTDLLDHGLVPINVALIQTSLPDSHGCMSLGVSVDVVKAAIENASLVIAQVNSNMPRVHGDGFIPVENADYIIHYDEPLLEYHTIGSDDTAQRIGGYVARIVQDGDTIQVGFGSYPDTLLANLDNKKHLGVHTGLLTDGIVELMKKHVIDNSRKTVDRGKTVATFCMGSRATYEYIDDNPNIEFRTIDYTNNPLVIAQQRNITTINSAREIDLTGQATAESMGRTFYGGLGGQADFMRGGVLAPGGKTILTLPSTADGEQLSRIVPLLKEGAGVTLSRGDIYYVVTEYGIAYLYGKTIRERAMELIGIAHPKFRPWLIEEAKRLNLIYKDQAFVPGQKGEYPEHLEVFRTTKSGLTVLLRPAKISDEPLLKDFFYSLSDQSLYLRFFSARKDMPHERLQEYVAVDFSEEMIILATTKRNEKELVLGLGEFRRCEDSYAAEVALVVRDDWQNRGIGTELLSYLTYLARRRGLLGFTAEVFADNRSMLHLFEKAGFEIEQRRSEGAYDLKMTFR